MALTEFGKAVRKARIDADQTLVTMAKALGTTPAFLSAMETGSKKVPDKWVNAINTFFIDRDIRIPELDKLANVSNNIIPTEGLSLQHKMLVAGFAKSEMSATELESFANLLEKINKKKEELNDV